MKITVRDYATYQYFPNVIVKLQRLYPAEGIWRTVQMDESGDFGLVFFNIKEENTDYRLLFYDRSNNLLKTTESLKFICDQGVCELATTVSAYDSILIETPIEVSYNLDNATKILTVNWEDPNAESKTVNIKVVKKIMTGSVTACDTTQIGAAGIYSCNISIYTGDLFLDVSANGVSTLGVWINAGRSKLATVINSNDGGLWAFAIMITIIMFGVVLGGISCVFATVVGLIAVHFLGIFSPITLAFIIIAMAIGMLISFNMRR
jgi:hypothetical protein